MKLSNPFRFRTSAGSRTPLFSRSRLKWLLLGCGICLLAFIIGLYLLFPTHALQERIAREFAQQTDAELTMADLSLLFPPALDADDVVISGLPGRERVELDGLTVRPLWHTLMGDRPGIRYRAALQGGTIDGTAREPGAIEAQARDITFDESLGGGTALRIAGQLREGYFSSSLPLAPETETTLNVAFENLRITGMEGLGASEDTLSLGRVVLQGEGKGRALRLQQIDGEGGDLTVSGSGSLLLTEPVHRSRLNLTLELRPGAEMDQNLQDLLSLFARPSRDGSFRLRLGGTLANPIFAQ